MKKVFLIINIIILIAVSSYLILRIDNNEYIKCQIGSENAINKIKNNLEETDENILTSLLFNGEALPFDSTQNTFYLPLSMEDKSWEYGDLLSGDDKVGILFIDSIRNINKAEVIREGKSFSFLAYTGNMYKIYSIIFTGLPIMNISVQDGDMNESANINMTLYESESKSDWVKSSLASIRVRGNTSTMYPKLGYKMELAKYNKNGELVNNNLALLDMREDNDWILYAMYNDDTKVRDKLSIDIWNEFGAKNNPFNLEFGTKLEYVELIVNGQYHGIYGLMEPVDAKKLDISKKRNENVEEYIYKRTTPTILSLEDFTEEADNYVKCGFELKGISRYKEVSLSSWNPLGRFIDLHVNADDVRYEQELPNIIDIESITDTWLFLQIISGLDNRAKNMYYVSKYIDGKNKLYFVPWDMDLTWGYVSKGDRPPLYTAFEEEMLTEYVSFETADRVMQLDVDNSIEIAKNKWKILRSTILTDESLTKRIEALEKTVVESGAMQREANRWPEGGHTTDYSEIKKYAVDKMNYLDEYMSSISKNNVIK